MKWLCKIGIHKYRHFGYNSLIFLFPIMRCERCGIGRQFCMTHVLTYTKAELDAAKLSRDEGNENNPHEFGAGVEITPQAIYWRNRSQVWMRRAIELGWDAEANHENQK